MSQELTPHKPYDVLFFVGRLSPLTIGHKHNIDRALELANRVVVIIGSACKARDTRTPFTYEERAEMVRAVYPDEFNKTIFTEPLRDYPYNDTVWASYVQKIVATHSGKNNKIGLIGHQKEDTYYLNLFPQWDFVPVESYGDDSVINATAVRKAFFEGVNFSEITSLVPQAIIEFLAKFQYGDTYRMYEQFITDTYRELKNEYYHILKYKAAWDKAPYAPTFLTTDCLVVQSGHVLLIKRKSAPGKNLWAIPGGFLNQGERIVDGIFRELFEETKIKVPEAVLRGNLEGIQVYDFPKRSLRGRVVTHAGIVYLNDGPLPKVKGSDDAAKAFWVPISEVMANPDKFFEDHYYLIIDLLERFKPRMGKSK